MTIMRSKFECFHFRVLYLPPFCHPPLYLPWATVITVEVGNRKMPICPQCSLSFERQHCRYAWTAQFLSPVSLSTSASLNLSPGGFAFTWFCLFVFRFRISLHQILSLNQYIKSGNDLNTTQQNYFAWQNGWVVFRLLTKLCVVVLNDKTECRTSKKKTALSLSASVVSVPPLRLPVSPAYLIQLFLSRCLRLTLFYAHHLSLTCPFFSVLICFSRISTRILQIPFIVQILFNEVRSCWLSVVLTGNKIARSARPLRP